jgi:uncharacterized repeat protein (TIGR03806 family)
MNSEYHASIAGLRRGLAAAIVLMITGCSGGVGGSDSPPESSPPPPPPPAPATVSGLDARPSNTTCLAPERATGSTAIGTERVFPNLKFTNQPVAMLQVPGDSSRWFVPGRLGTVKVFDNKPDVTATSDFIDLTARVESTCAECGMLGMAFHPDWPATPRVYLTYTTKERGLRGPNTHLSEFTSTDGGRTLDPDSERVIFKIYKDSDHHHAGRIDFGADGFLYMSTGDGGSFKLDNGQELKTLLGKMLRIDIRGTTGTALYKIPPDNPFAANALCNENGGLGPQNCPEIYAWGFRNPWRWTFDRATGDIWLGDVGETDIEEVDRVRRGGNYGWRCMEGTLDVASRWPTAAACAGKKDLLPPVAEFTHEVGHVVIGGVVYRGKAIPSLVGRYVFGSFGGFIWDIPNDTQPTMKIVAGLQSGLKPSSFNEGNDGEIYLTNIYADLRRITGPNSGGGAGVAAKLSATGCVSASNATLPASGLIPYAPNAPFWSDGAVKERWMGLPDGKNITVGADGDWDFPNGTVLMKNFRLDNRLVETRLFMRHPDGVWAGYSYEWNAEQTDATLVRGGKKVAIGGQTWIYPGEGQCLQCHTEAAGNTLGLETRQLASVFKYPQTGRDANQLVTLNTINVLTPAIDKPENEVPYPDPKGTAGTLNERARAYLHENCSQCHRPNGGSTANMDLRYTTALADTKACDVAPDLGDIGIADARLIAPGVATRSVLVARMSRRDEHGMPPIGSAKVDADGAALLTEWVNSLTSCN